MSKRIIYKSNAFTLVEIVIVILILGILVTVATVKYIDFTNLYQEKVVKANLSILKSAVEVYRAEHNMELPDKIISDLGKDNGLTSYLDTDFLEKLKDSNLLYKYSFNLTPDSLIIQVTGPNSFNESIVIGK